MSPGFTDEIWRPVVGWELFYEVSNHGRVKRVATTRGKIGGILRGNQTAGGYTSVCLCRYGSKKQYYVHSLVLEAFVGKRPANMEVCHGDGDRGNNQLHNLRWDTRKNNHADKIRHGTANRGEKNKTARLSESDVRDIRKKYVKGKFGVSGSGNASQLATEYGVSRSAIWSIVTKLNWRHVS